MMPSLVVLALTVVMLAHVGSGFPAVKRGASPVTTAAAGGGRERFASRDDMNVVAYGMLQLGQGLREHVDKNKVQMRDFNTQLQLLNGTLARLVQGGHRDGEVAVEVEARELEERRVEALASELRASEEEARADREAVLSRMDRLEERINQRERESESNDSGSFIQRILEAQNKQIDDLVEKIRQQQDKLEKNNLHLQTLQSKVVQTALREDMMEHNEPQTGLASDCQELFEQGQRASGVYTIQPLHSHPFPVLCEMTAEGGWTVVQKRQDGSQNFNQLWIQYQKGFGSLDGEFWLGLEHMHLLSRQGQHVLEVELSDWTGQKHLAQYHFDLDGAEQNYALHLHADLSSSSPGSLEVAGASGRPFSTSDRDNDLSDNSNCAKLLSGGWWFTNCGESNLNGRYPRRHNNKQTRTQQTMFWKTMTARHNPIRSTTLKIKHL